ncbi:SRPBCC family protein [Desulfurispira natronophila]|uniref:Ligand-binding SRPBCC domain-containing protein n=1 Tax=Desulfurispira natronophila TaxID=682562 RepID=A0A7W8DHD8_9BACT|nr:SRPBCC family protein [Desulfurispira natronophila]MBB5022173.1 ligand-binding SRPBCC domain-containing protein [Desulfurispira natronophila]
MHELRREITLDVPQETLWDFIATPRNLNLLTPPELDFQILSHLPPVMHNGLTIHYRIQVPPFGTYNWLTEIKHIHEGISFVDEQRLGPYRLWYHFHHIESIGPDKTHMIDHVTYALPFGPLGKIVHRIKVAKMLKGIFAYRRQKLLELFPSASS